MPERCDECNAEIVAPTIGTMRGVGFNFCSPRCRDEFASFSNSLGHVMVNSELSAPSGDPATETEGQNQHSLVGGSPPPSPGGGNMTPAAEIATPTVGLFPSLGKMTVEQLMENADAAHRRCEEALSRAITHAIEAGDLLNEAKSRVKHGEWARWVERKFSGSLRTAEAYMRLARKVRQLPPEKAQRVAVLPVRKALAAVSRWSGSTRCRENEVADGEQTRPQKELAATVWELGRNEPLFQLRFAALAEMEARRDRLQQEICVLRAQIEEERQALDHDLQLWRKGELVGPARPGTGGMDVGTDFDEAGASVSATIDHHVNASQPAAQWEEFSFGLD